MSEQAIDEDEARMLLDARMATYWQYSYRDLEARSGQRSEHQDRGVSGRDYSICVEVTPVSGLECTLEIRGSILELREDTTVPSLLRAKFRITPDDRRLGTPQASDADHQEMD